MSQSGGALIAAILKARGIDTVFSVAGASHSYLLDSLDRQGTHIISHRHEAGAVGAADGYARVLGKPGVALIVADQGLPNAIGALAVAWHACTPVVLMVATPPRHMVEAELLIDQDKLALVTPISKWARTVPSRARLRDYIETALKIARAGRPGPVVLLVPEEQLQQQGSDGMISVPAAPSRPHADPAAIAAAADLIARARRPLIVAGAGCAWGEASGALQRLVHDLGLPLMANSMGRGQVAEDFERVFSWPYGQLAAKEADCVIVAGARLTQRLGLGLPPRFAVDARFIQIDIAAEAFHRNRPVDIAIHADAGVALTALADALSERQLAHEGPGWIGEALSSRKARVSELAVRGEGALHPLEMGAAIASYMPSGAVYVGDGADIQSWMYGAIAIRRPRGFMDHYPMGAMGSGTALAVGAAAALKEAGDPSPVFLVTGDGSIGFHPAELHAAAMADLKLITLVGNDGAWGTELHGQIKALGRDINTRLGALPYEKLAEAFANLGFRAETRAELDDALIAALAMPGPSLINVLIDPEAGRELKDNPDVRMILFSDILEGQASL